MIRSSAIPSAKYSCSGSPLRLAANDSESNPARYRDWIESTLGPRGIQIAVMWPTLNDHAPGELNSFDAVFIGGGNTFDLLQQLRETGFAEQLVHFCAEDRVIYGGSAGAIILGRDIASCIHYDENRVGLTDTSGLDVCLGHCVWCHHEPEQEVLIEEYVQSTSQVMLVIPKTAGVFVTPNGLWSLGTDPVLHWTKAGRTTIHHRAP